MMRSFKSIFYLFLMILAWTSLSCHKDPLVSKYSTQHLVIVVVDGARYTETWGDPQRQYIPMRSAFLAPLGTLCSNMYNKGATLTEAGYLAFTRGRYESISNNGTEYPSQPSFLQYWLKHSGKPAEKAWLITTKDKLEVQANCTDPEWKDKFNPRTNCGIAGLGTGYRQDTTTLRIAKEVIGKHHPDVMVIGFKEPDASGHAADWNGYLKGLTDTDLYCKQLWDLLQADPYYAGTTTFMIINDHGRHRTGHNDGFVSHGDGCEGCKHIEFLAIGPDIAAGRTDTKEHSQVDIAVTAAELLGFKMENVKGKMLTGILK